MCDRKLTFINANKLRMTSNKIVIYWKAIFCLFSALRVSVLTNNHQDLIKIWKISKMRFFLFRGIIVSLWNIEIIFTSTFMQEISFDVKDLTHVINLKTLSKWRISKTLYLLLYEHSCPQIAAAQSLGATMSDKLNRRFVFLAQGRLWTDRKIRLVCCNHTEACTLTFTAWSTSYRQQIRRALSAPVLLLCTMVGILILATPR